MRSLPLAKLLLSGLAALTALGVGASTASAQKILVYDGSSHQAALTAAEARFPGNVTVATSINFDSLVTAQPWDLVLVNSPGARPTSWLNLAFYILGGGRTVVSYWDYDDSTYPGTPELLAVIEVSVKASISLDGTTMFDSDTTNTFFGITMPNSDWHDHWGDDGDTFNLLGGAVGVAHMGNPAEPVMVLGNNGRSLLMPAMDEVGDSWTLGASDVAMWDNCIDVVWNNGGCLHYHGALGLNPGGFHCTFNPQAGYPWRARIDPVPTLGVSTFATVVVLGLGGATDGTLIRGYELLALGPYIFDTGFEFHKLMVPPGLIGTTIRAQGLRIETLAGGENRYVLLNSLDLTIG